MGVRGLSCVSVVVLASLVACGGDDGGASAGGDAGSVDDAADAGDESARGDHGDSGSGGQEGTSGTSTSGGSAGSSGDGGGPGNAGCDAPVEQVPDMDADGFGDRDAVPAWVCPGVKGFSTDPRDCDDGSRAVHPEAAEVCDDIDNDCDDHIDEALRIASWPDVDMDGYGDGSAVAHEGCAVPAGYVTNDDDCGDLDPRVHPAADTARCDGVDTNCDGSVEEITVPDVALTAAIARASAGQWICVAPGTHLGLVTVDRPVVIVGAGAGPEATVLDGEGAGSVVRVEAGGSGSELHNLTLRHGGLQWGAGAHLLGNATLDRVIVEDNHCVGACRGGGVYVGPGRAVTIRNSVIRDNRISAASNAQFALGGGIYTEGTFTLEDSRVEGNDISGVGGLSTIQLFGAGLHVQSGSAAVRRTALFGNTAHDGSAVGGGAIHTLVTTTLDRVDMRDNHVTGGYVYGSALLTRGATTTATNIIAAGNHATATDPFGNAFGTVAVLGTSAAIHLTNATLFGNHVSALHEVRGCALSASGNNLDLSFNNVIIESHVCGGGALIAGNLGWLTGSYTSQHGNNVAPGYTGLLTDSGSFVSTAGSDPAAWDLHLATTSALRHVGDPAILDADGTRSSLGGYGGPNGE